MGKKRMIYASPLMKGWQVREACQQFREQEAAIRRQQMTAVKGGGLSEQHSVRGDSRVPVACQ